MKLKLCLFVLAAVGGFAVGYGALAKADAAWHYGYFYGIHDSFGDDVWPSWGGPAACRGDGNALPYWVNNAGAFINFTLCKLNQGSAREHVGAAFIISTMTGMRNPNPGATEINEFTSRVNYAASRGWINFGASVNLAPNTFWQGCCGGGSNPNDVGTYSGSGVGAAIAFSNGSNPLNYVIRRECANPLGAMQPLPPRPLDQYNLTPSITTRVDGAAVSGGAEVGQTIQFTYSIRNSGSDPSPANTNCSINANVHVGYFTARSNPPPGGGAGPPTGCPRSFPANSNNPLGGVENVPVTVGNRTICRSLFVSPATASIGRRSVEACVPVINKPYFKVYGGDLSAGNGLENPSGTCTGNARAAVIGWNRGSGGGYGGAGVQFAIFALHQIYETTTAVGNVGPRRAPVPRGFAFAGNTLNGSLYGGNYGSLPCMEDYYAARPSGAPSFTTLAATTASGAYVWNGPGHLNLSGPVAAGKRITVYVNGNVFINNNITYPANWTSGDPPLLEVVARGNIYIRNGVSRIDGVFIAQKSGATGGTIYTCTIGPAPLVADNSLYNRCNNKLTINGAFVAAQIQFLRVNGTRQGGTANEASGSPNIAEVFNFSPVLWMAQPVGSTARPAEYDSISSLPPIL